MGDYFPGEIKIGGRIPTGLVEELCGQIETQGVSLDYGGDPFSPRSAKDLVAAAKAEALRLCDAEARCGQFEELEEWLVKNNFGFSRHSDARYEYDAENVEFRPGMDEPATFGSTEDGKVTVMAEELREKLYPLLRKKQAAKALAALKALVGDGIPPLGPLTIGR